MKNVGSTHSSEKSKDHSSIWVLIISFILTAVCSVYVASTVEHDDEKRFMNLANHAEYVLSRRIEVYENLILQTRALFISHTKGLVGRQEFHNYIDSLGVTQRFPGVSSLGFVARVKPKQVASFEKKARTEGFPEFRIWPQPSVKDSFAVVYSEPLNVRNRKSLGFNLSTESTRREVMNRAWTSGNPTISGIIRLITTGTEAPKPGFIMCVPVYSGGRTPPTLIERKAQLVGFLYGAFRADELFPSIFHSRDRPIDIAIFDNGGPGQNESLLYDHDGHFVSPLPKKDPRFVHEDQVGLVGRTWTVRTASNSNFELSASRWTPLLTVLAGILVSLLLYRLSATSARYRQKERVRLAREQQAHAESRSHVETLETLGQVSRNLLAELDLPKLVQGIIDAATQLSHADVGVFFCRLGQENGQSSVLFNISGSPAGGAYLAKHPPCLVSHSTDKSIVRIADISQSGGDEVFQTIFGGEISIASYLSVPVISRSREVLGRLFFGHERPNIFTEREAELVSGIAAQAAVALDNASLYKKAQDAIAARDDFLSICSHELKTPLTSLKLHLQLNKRELQSPENFTPAKFAKLIGIFDRQVDRLSRLVEDILDWTHISNGQLALHPSMTELSTLTRDVLERLAPQLSAANCQVQIVNTSLSVTGQWDRFRLEQVLTNLVTNAIKYGRGKPVVVKIGADTQGAWLSVEDQGLGIATEDQSRIFERFERAVPANRISGLGLGLFIVKHIVEAHEGSISVESSLGQGATFTVRLPQISRPGPTESTNIFPDPS